MRRLIDRQRLHRVLRGLGAAAARPVQVYLTGGATAVMHGWRSSTVDVDLVFVPEDDRLFRALPRLKEELEVNLEIVSPAHFLPELPGWRQRSLPIGREGNAELYHYDPYAQALSKIERGHRQDLEDVGHLLDEGLVDGAELLRLFAEIEPQLYRFPAVDPPALRRAVERVAAQAAAAAERDR